MAESSQESGDALPDKDGTGRDEEALEEEQEEVRTTWGDGNAGGSGVHRIGETVAVPPASSITQYHQVSSPRRQILQQQHRSLLQKRSAPSLTVHTVPTRSSASGGCTNAIKRKSHRGSHELEETTGGGADEEDTEHLPVFSVSPGAESTPDSCYDSDPGSGSGSRRSSCTTRSDTDYHEDVSRTASDTLAEEHTPPPALEVVISPTIAIVEAPDLFGDQDTEDTAHCDTECQSDRNRLVEDMAGSGEESNRDPLVKQETQEFSLCGAVTELPPDIDIDLTVPDEVVENPPAAYPVMMSSSECLKLSDVKQATVAQAASDLQELALDASLPGDSYTDDSGPDVIIEDEQEVVEGGQGGDCEEEEQSEGSVNMKAVRYGIRLGYSQELTQRVLQKLGPDAGKDDLLQELIRYTDVEKGDEVEEEEEDDEGPVMCSWVPQSGAPTPPPPKTTAYGVSFTSDIATADTTSIPDVDKPEQQLMVTDNVLSLAAGGKDPSNLRAIIIDGSNIAMSHGNKQVFSCRGIKLAVDYFRDRGHTKVTVFVPSWRKEASRQDTQIVDQEVLYELEQDKTLVFTPSRWVSGKRIVCYDDLYIIKLAAEDDGIVVSNDNYRDLINKSPEYKKVIEERLLMYSFVNDRFMPPDDPLGRHGPSLDNFLSKRPVAPEPLPPACPYGKKCTYGNKCKYYHPERGTTPRKSVLEVLQEKERVEIAKVRPMTKSRESSPGDIGTREKSPTPSESCKRPKARTSAPSSKSGVLGKKALGRTKSLATGVLVNNKGESAISAIMSNIPSGPSSEVVDRRANQVPFGETTSMDVQTVAMDAAKAAQMTYQEIPLKDPDTKSTKLGASDGICHSLEALSLPGGWASAPVNLQGGNDTLRQLKPLRPTHSDPQGEVHFDSGWGHLSLAKKLSDEGVKRFDDGSHTRNLYLSAASSVAATGSTPTAVVSPHASPCRQRIGTDEKNTASMNSTNGHKRLQRQLSLQGAEDPRLIMKTFGRGSNLGQGGQKMKREKRQPLGTKFTFHGTGSNLMAFQGAYYQQEGQHITADNAAMSYTEPEQQQQQPITSQQQHQQHLLQQQQHQQNQQQLHQFNTAAEHAFLNRHSSFSGEVFPQQPDPYQSIPQQQQQQKQQQQQLHQQHQQHKQQQHQNMRMLPADRITACRMSSAPGTYSPQKGSVGGGGAGPGPQWQHSLSLMPTIHRQNSTSDPQLHILQESAAIRDINDPRLQGIYGQHGMRRTFCDSRFNAPGAELAYNRDVVWSQSSHVFDMVNRAGRFGAGGSHGFFDDHLNLPGVALDDRIPRCGSFDSSLPKSHNVGGSSSFDNAVHMSSSFEELTSAAQHTEKSHSFEGHISSSDMGHYGASIEGSIDMGSTTHQYYRRENSSGGGSVGTPQSPEHKGYTSANPAAQSLFMAGRMHGSASSGDIGFYGGPGMHHPALNAPRKSSQDVYSVLQQMAPQHQSQSPPQPSPPLASQQNQQQSQPLQETLFGSGGPQFGHRIVNRISPVMMSSSDSAVSSADGAPLLPSACSSPPHPDDQIPGSIPSETQHQQQQQHMNQQRCKLFYHLSGLFPETEVREAMQKLPHETQPEKLLSYIIGMRSLHSK